MYNFIKIGFSFTNQPKDDSFAVRKQYDKNFYENKHHSIILHMHIIIIIKYEKMDFVNVYQNRHNVRSEQPRRDRNLFVYIRE